MAEHRALENVTSDEAAAGDSVAGDGIGHWSRQPGALASVRSLLAREMSRTVDYHMSEWLMAVIEDIEYEVASSNDSVVHFENELAEEFLNSVSAMIRLENQKGFEVR